tara:strand:+ start:5684 stop:6625 length:942 start_codon:yes stop_codon:yes gene_type:complete
MSLPDSPAHAIPGREGQAPAVPAAHRPVMCDEALAALGLRPGGCYVDATFGRGGHAARIHAALEGSGRLHLFDQDPEAIAVARARYGEAANVRIHAANFASLAQALADDVGRVDGILIDLGVSSPQLDNAERGFSFSHDGPLDMRMNPSAGQSAAEWLAQAESDDIADVLWRFGDERNSRRIARRIVETRQTAPLTRTRELAELIAKVPGPRSKHHHPATRSFQAIRIHINGEMSALEAALPQAVEALAPAGRLVVISFHSLEDRMVKRYLRNEGSADAPRIKVLKKQFPSDAECAVNPRARSAMLRSAERLP